MDSVVGGLCWWSPSREADACGFHFGDMMFVCRGSCVWIPTLEALVRGFRFGELTLVDPSWQPLACGFCSTESLLVDSVAEVLLIDSVSGSRCLWIPSREPPSCGFRPVRLRGLLFIASSLKSWREALAFLFVLQTVTEEPTSGLASCIVSGCVILRCFDSLFRNLFGRRQTG